MYSGFPTVALLNPILFVLLLLAAGGFAVVKVVQTHSKRQHALPSPVRTIRASVVSKRATVIQNWDTHPVPSDYVRPSMVYYVTFQQLEFSVQEAVYHTLFTGDTGMLTFQGAQYFAFEP